MGHADRTPSKPEKNVRVKPNLTEFLYENMGMVHNAKEQAIMSLKKPPDQGWG